MILYWLLLKPKSFSKPSVLAFPKFPLSSELKKYMQAKIGSNRKSNFRHSARSAAWSNIYADSAAVPILDSGSSSVLAIAGGIFLSSPKDPELWDWGV